MPYELKFEPDLFIIVVRFYGDSNLQEFLTSRTDTGAECRRQNCDYVLVDMREMKAPDENLSLADCFTFSESFQRIDGSRLPPGVIVAGVMPLDSKAREKIEFMALASVNRGAPLKPFHNYDEAIQWLADKSQKEVRISARVSSRSDNGAGSEGIAGKG
jgi:hypothetical protein